MATKTTTPVADPKKNIEVRDQLPDTPPATKTEVVAAHVNIHRPFYVWLPIALIGAWAAIKGYTSLTGRSPVDDVPMGAVWNIILVISVAVLVNNAKPRSYDDIDTTDRTIPWWHICLDYFATCFLYALFTWAVFH